MTEIEQIYCRRCERDTDHAVLHMNTREPGPQAGPHAPWCRDAMSVECRGCQTLSVLENEIYENDVYDTDPRSWQLLPAIPRARRKQDHGITNAIPTNLRRIYSESVSALGHDMRILCATGVRILLEGVCGDLGIKGKVVEKDGKPVMKQDGSPKLKTSLHGKIQGLADGSRLTPKHASQIQSLRILGNEAVHELSVPSKDELNLALDFVEDLLNQVYGVDRKHAELTRLGNERKAAEAETGEEGAETAD